LYFFDTFLSIAFQNFYLGIAKRFLLCYDYINKILFASKQFGQTGNFMAKQQKRKMIELGGTHMSSYILGLDNGGSTTKCVIYNQNGEECGIGSASVNLIMPKPGMTERDPQQVWQANKKAIQEAMQRAGVTGKDIAAVGLTGYGNGACLVDAAGNPVYNCIVSTDSRAAPYLSRWQQDGTEDTVYQYTYQTIWAAQPAALIPWFRDHAPQFLDKAAYTLSIKDYIRAKLTGNLCAELTDASSGCLMNIKTREYDRRIFEALGIQDFFHLAPPFLKSTDITGYVTRQAAEETGLAEGTPVSGGYFDIDAGALASGILEEKALCLIAGTWSINEYITKDLESGYGKFSNTVGYLPGYYVVEDSSPTSASNFDWYIKNLESSDANTLNFTYERCNALLAQMRPEDNEIVFVPYLYASATNPNSKGAFLNLSGYHTKAHLMQAVYEGVTFSTMFHVKRLTNGQWKDCRYARFSGGAARSPVWTQMFSDVLQLPIEVPAAKELSAMGAAISAAIAIGWFRDEQQAADAMCRVTRRYDPDASRGAIYQEKFRRFEKALESISIFHTE